MLKSPRTQKVHFQSSALSPYVSGKHRSPEFPPLSWTMKGRLWPTFASSSADPKEPFTILQLPQQPAKLLCQWQAPFERWTEAVNILSCMAFSWSKNIQCLHVLTLSRTCSVPIYIKWQRVSWRGVHKISDFQMTTHYAWHADGHDGLAPERLLRIAWALCHMESKDECWWMYWGGRQEMLGIDQSNSRRQTRKTSEP